MAGYIGSKTSVVSSGVERKKTYSITGSTTSLTGLNYTVGKVHVYQNGVRLLDGTDYTATNGTSITLTVAAQSGDNVVVVSQAAFQLSESYTSTESDARYVEVAGDTMTGNLNVTGTVTADNGSSTGQLNGNSLVFDRNSANYIRTSDAAGYLRLQTGSGDTAFFSANGDISFYEDTGTTPKFFWDASAEALGIGTTSPSLGSNGSGLHIKGASGEYGVLKVDSSTTSEEGWVQFSNNGVDKFRIASDSSTNLKFIHSGVAERMRIDSSGRVGIGTSSPSSALHIAGAGTNNQLKLERTGDGTGSYYIAATENSLAFMSDLSNERMRIDSSGNVGIGVSSSVGEALHVKGTGRFENSNATPVSVHVNSGNNDYGQIFASTSSAWKNLVLNQYGGKVGIGTSSPVTNLDVVTTSAGTRARIRSNTTSSPTAGLELCRGTTSTFGADAYTDFLIENINGGHLAFSSGTNGTTLERMRLDSSGNVLMGKASASIDVDGVMAHNGGYINATNTNGSAAYFNRKGSDGGIVNFQNDGSSVGSISVSGSSTAYNTSSDYRLKENVVDLTGASARVNQLDVKRFNFIADDTNTLVDGFLAHEVATVVPEAVTGTHDGMKDEEYEVTPAVEATYDDDGNELTAAVEAVMGTRSVPDYQGIDQSKLVPLLTAALQEALTEIASLKTRVEALEA